MTLFKSTHLNPSANRLYPIAVALLIFLFTYAALSKLLVFSEFKVQLYRQAIPHSWAGPLSCLIPAAELITAGLLCLKVLRFAGLLCSGVLLTWFTGYILLIITGFWKHAPCPCGGILSHMGWTGHFLFNLIFLLLNLTALYIHFKERRATNRR